jgi:farnesyl-diphosphate farnesyltransferase
MEPLRHPADPDFSLMPWLFPRPLQQHIRAFGRFVRLADGLADATYLSRDERLERLQALAAAVDGGERAGWSEEAATVSRALAEGLRSKAIRAEHVRHIVQAFSRDILGVANQTWSDLLVYCQFAAAPIGRVMLELVGEDLSRCGQPADALCAALRILKQLRDCEDPTVRSNRLCIPARYLQEAMITAQHLRAPSARGQTRAVLDRVLDGVDRLLVQAAPLPGLIRSRGLATHTRIVLCRAGKLAQCFRARDPLQDRAGLSRWQRQVCLLSGLLFGMTQRPRKPG